MDSENRVPLPGSTPQRRGISPPFYRVDRREPDGSERHYVVHTQSPKFVVEFEAAAKPSTHTGAEGAKPDVGAKSRPVLRRICVPNSWAGDYHHCARQLGAAADFFASTDSESA